MVAVKNAHISSKVEELDTKCEIVWVRVNVEGKKSFLVGGYYHPHTTDEDSHDQLKLSLERLVSSTQHIWFAGDFNLPDIMWETNTIREDSRHKNIQQRFMDTFDETGH